MKSKGWVIKGLRRILHFAKEEFVTIATNPAILLVLVGGVFIYGLLYNYMYLPNQVLNIPIAVVDQSRDQLSGQYIRYLDATPEIHVLTNSVDFPMAKELIKRGQAKGILYIPIDFQSRIEQGQQSIFLIYETTSAFLYYMAMQQATTFSLLNINQKIRPSMVVFLPMKDVSTITQTLPIQVVGQALFNPTQGYGQYLIPSVLVIILFQTLMMVIGMISGDEWGKGTILRFKPYIRTPFSMFSVIIGKTILYVSLYGIFSLFMLGFLPLLFDLQHIGRWFDVVILIIPFLLATSFLGLTASVFFTDSETPLLMIAFFSVGLLFLSGVSYPLELMPWYWQLAHYLFPASPAALAYVKINSMGASMGDIRYEYMTLWIQCLVYFFGALFAYWYNVRRYIRLKNVK